MPPSTFLLDTITLCVLSHYHGVPTIKTWNGPAKVSFLRQEV
jgi:hypothetical protein